MRFLIAFLFLSFLSACSGGPFVDNSGAAEYAAEMADAPIEREYYPGAEASDATAAAESVIETVQVIADNYDATQQAKREVAAATENARPDSSDVWLCSQIITDTSTVCKIPRAYCSYKPLTEGSPTYCNDAPYPSQKFTLLRWGENWSHLNGQCLIVTGFVKMYDGKPQIEAIGLSQVQTCE